MRLKKKNLVSWRVECWYFYCALVSVTAMTYCLLLSIDWPEPPSPQKQSSRTAGRHNDLSPRRHGRDNACNADLRYTQTDMDNSLKANVVVWCDAALERSELSTPLCRAFISPLTCIGHTHSNSRQWLAAVLADSPHAI